MRSQANLKAKKPDKAQKLRVKNEPPTYEEAMLAAACITDEASQQVEIAAELLGLSLTPENVKALNAAKPRGNVVDIASRSGGSRTVVVEKKRSIRTAVPKLASITPRALAGQLKLGRI